MRKLYSSDMRGLPVAAIVVALSLSAPAFGAGDAYKAACASYKKGDYANAKVQFEKVLKSKPTNWQAEYQLANCCSQLRSYAQARQWYCSCLTHHPDASTAGYCQSAVGQIDGMASGQRNAAAAAAAAAQEKMKAENAAFNAERDKEDKTRSDQQLAVRKKAIMDQAQKKADEIKNAGEARLAEAAANSNRRVIDPNTGNVTMDISPDEKQAIMKDYEQQRQRVLEQARRDCDSLR